MAKTKSTPSLLKQSLKKITKEKRRSKSETDAAASSPARGVLVRSKNDTPLLKVNSGHRASPRAGSPDKSPASKRSKSREQFNNAGWIKIYFITVRSGHKVSGFVQRKLTL